MNPFDSLGDGDAEDASLLMAANQQEVVGAVTEDAESQPLAKKAPQTQPQVEQIPNLPSKPLPTAQAEDEIKREEEAADAKKENPTNEPEEKEPEDKILVDMGNNKKDTVAQEEHPDLEMERLLEDIKEEHDRTVFMIKNHRSMIEDLESNNISLQRKKEHLEGIFSRMKNLYNGSNFEYFVGKLQEEHKEAAKLAGLNMEKYTAGFKLAIGLASFLLGVASACVWRA